MKTILGIICSVLTGFFIAVVGMGLMASRNSKPSTAGVYYVNYTFQYANTLGFGVGFAETTLSRAPAKFDDVMSVRDHIATNSKPPITNVVIINWRKLE